MRVEIEYQGKRYIGIDTTEHTVKEVSEEFYKNFDKLVKFKMESPDGGVLILGKDALQSAVVMFLP